VKAHIKYSLTYPGTPNSKENNFRLFLNIKEIMAHKIKISDVPIKFEKRKVVR
jgi:hypothetical protein